VLYRSSKLASSRHIYLSYYGIDHMPERPVSLNLASLYSCSDPPLSMESAHFLRWTGIPDAGIPLQLIPISQDELELGDQIGRYRRFGTFVLRW
jgi:hypothetical protein